MSGELTKLTRAELQDMIARASYGEGKIKLNLCGYDLTGVDLSYLDLSEARLLHCTLNEIELYCTDMSSALLEECTIRTISREIGKPARKNNFNGVRFLYHKNSEAIGESIKSTHTRRLIRRELNTIEEKLVSGGTLKFFHGATVVYWDKKAGMYLTHVVPPGVYEEDVDE